MSAFASILVKWQRAHGRRGLPWQGTRDPYRVWLSEVMLQQTQVAAVIPYYERFLERFPTVEALARAREEEVLELWSGLGYYARGRNLHSAARIIARTGFPRDSFSIEKLPGVGRSTAAAIAAFAFGERAAILDGNVKRVLARHFGVEGEERQWGLAEQLLPSRDVETYTQALMDLGATVCTRLAPRCQSCPVTKTCFARRRRLTEKLPSPRAKKALPTRRAKWFVALREDKVFMEKRPSAGIWGGLWSFPETLPARWKVVGKLAPLEHGFTHFRLKVSPMLCEGSEGEGRWFTLAQARAAAVPTPVRRLLESGLGARGVRAGPGARGAPASAARAAAARRAGR